MLEIITQMGLPLLGAGVGWFIGRYVRKDHIDEGIKRRGNTLELMEKMRAMGVSMNEVDMVLASIEGRPAQQSLKHLTLEDKIEDAELKEFSKASTQVEMNQIASSRSERLDTALRDAFNQVLDNATPHIWQQLKATQGAWEAYRDQELELARAHWGSGSMLPVILAGTRSRLTKQRIGELQETLRIFQ